jgi:hypothetical protein
VPLWFKTLKNGAALKNAKFTADELAEIEGILA